MTAATEKPARVERASPDVLQQAIAFAENDGVLDAHESSAARRGVDLLVEAQPGKGLVWVPEEAELLHRALAHFDERQRRRYWPPCASGPCEAGPFGLVIPDSVKTKAEALAIADQLARTRLLRELRPREKRAVRALRLRGLRPRPTGTHEFTAIAKNNLRQLSKKAKRARAAQRTMEGARAALQRLQETAATVATLEEAVSTTVREVSSQVLPAEVAHAG